MNYKHFDTKCNCFNNKVIDNNLFVYLSTCQCVYLKVICLFYLVLINVFTLSQGNIIELSIKSKPLGTKLSRRKSNLVFICVHGVQIENNTLCETTLK